MEVNMKEILGRTAYRDVVGMGGLNLERKRGAAICGRGEGRDKRE